MRFPLTYNSTDFFNRLLLTLSDCVFCIFFKGEKVAELILHHARANECQDEPQFKKEMAQLVDHAVGNTLSLEKV